jgi:hypothetical protein
MTRPRRRPIRDVVYGALFFVFLARPSSADSALDQVAVFDPTVHFGPGQSITFAPQLQTRFTAVETGAPAAESVAGFSVPRARLIIVTRVLDDAFRFRFRIGAGSTGGASFQEAYGEANWGHFRFRAGQVLLKLNSPEEPSIQGLSTADFSSYSNAFAGGATQGIELAYRGPVRFIATIGNGARSGFSELLAPIVADVATTGRFEIPIGPQGLADYDTQASFRHCQPLNARLGLVGHFQTRHRNDPPVYDLGMVSADVGIRGSGFSVLTSAAYTSIAPAGETTVQAAGLFVLGSLFLSRDVESFAQFDAVWPLGAKAPVPPSLSTSKQPGTTMFRTLTIGSNFFIIPDVHRLKVQMDLQAMFDGQTTSFIPPNGALGVLPASGPQGAMRVQLVVAL